MKKALVIATFGSSYLDSLSESLVPIIQDLKVKFPDYDFYIGFTSQMILKILKERGIHVHSVDEILEELVCSGYDKVLVFTNFLIPGTEYNKLLNTVKKQKDHFSNLSVTKPYIFPGKRLEELTSFLINQIDSNDTFYLYMGHGSNHPENRLYHFLNDELIKNSIENLRITCIDGDNNFESLLSSNILDNWDHIELRPFMLVAGDHVKNDMIGNNNSWLNQLRNLGLKVSFNEDPLLKNKEFRALILK